MSVELVRYNEPLDIEELSFLIRKERKEKGQFFKTVRVITALCFLCPFIVAWFRAGEGAENPFSYTNYFIGVAFLLVFAGAGLYISYYKNLRKVQVDIRHRTKTIERTHILRKQYMQLNNCFYFYIDSPNKLSIEVKEDDFNRLDSGDEVNIEYTTFAKLYLGYF